MAGIPWRLLLAVAMWLCAGAAAAEDARIAVIVSSQTPRQFTVDRATLRRIFLKKVFVDEEGRPLIPVNLPPESPLRHSFALAAIDMSDDQLRAYWNRLYFQGVSPPYVLGSQQAVVRFVANTPGAIGYVMPCFLDARVRQVLFLPLPPEVNGHLDSCPPQQNP